MENRISIAVDLLVFTIDEQKLKVLMVKREYAPYAGWLALPGVLVGYDETLDEAAKRGIREEVGLENIYFEQLYTWGALDRDPRNRTISVSYMALVPVEQMQGFAAGQRTTDAMLVEVGKLLGMDDIAFDHKEIIRYAK